jgi:DNA-binding PadR family transcriptional regulator
MPGAWPLAAGDFDPRLLQALRCAAGLAGQWRASARTGPGTAARGHGPWPREGGPGGSRGWAGGAGTWAGWWPGPPGPGRGGPKAGRGDVRAAILALLGEGPRNGYQLMSEIEQRSGGAWRPSPGAVYPALQQLADEGLIAAATSAGRRTFSLTESGQRAVAENPDMARPAWEGMAGTGPGPVSGLFAQAARLGASIVQMAHAGTPGQVREAEKLLEQTRRGMYQILASDLPAEPDAGEDTEESRHG